MLLVISCIWLLPYLYQPQVPDPAIIRMADSSIVQIQKNKLRQNISSADINAFNFDPNTLSDSGWKELGLKDKVIHTIRNYVLKGGKFKSPDDLRRIYGLHQQEADRLIPFVQIEKLKVPKKQFATTKDDFHLFRASGNSISNNQQVFAKRYNRDRGSLKIVDLNLADTSALIDLPGIGSKLAKRIIDFRNHAGGFHTVDQLADIYGLEDSVVQKLKSYLKVSGDFKRILINHISVDSLAMHPYISKSQARAIVQFRQMHGPFENIEKLKMIHNLDQTTLDRVQVYLDFNVIE